MKDENEIIRLAFNKGRFLNTFKSNDEIYETSKAVYETFEKIKIQDPELYNEIIGKIAGKVVNAGGELKDKIKGGIKSAFNRTADYIKRQPEEYRKEREKRLGAKAPTERNENDRERIDNPPPSERQREASQGSPTNSIDASKIKRLKTALNVIVSKAYAEPGKVSQMLNDPNFQEGINKLMSSEGFKNLLKGRNSRLLSTAIATYIVGSSSTNQKNAERFNKTEQIRTQRNIEADRNIHIRDNGD